MVEAERASYPIVWMRGCWPCRGRMGFSSTTASWPLREIGDISSADRWLRLVPPNRANEAHHRKRSIHKAGTDDDRATGNDQCLVPLVTLTMHTCAPATGG